MNTRISDAAVSLLPVRNSLRAKGFAATVALVLYVAVSVAYVATQRARIYDSMQTLQQLSLHEKALALAEAAVNTAVIDVSEASNEVERGPASVTEVSMYMETCAKLFAALSPFDARYAQLERSIVRSYETLRAQPVRANWIDLRESLARASSALDVQHRGLSESRDRLIHDYQHRYDAVAVESLLLSLLGITLFGLIAAWFFARLSGDIRQLELHARQIVRGARGVALPVVRRDELGSLMQAVNQMATDLDVREQQIELETQRRSHNDKMVAVGALAAGVAHEVNNPLAVIVGTAQELSHMQGGFTAAGVADAAQLILGQAERAAFAARNLAELVQPQPTEFDWVDVNALIARLLKLMGYDKRYRHIRMESRLSPQVPAVHAPGAALQQVLMQLLSLACDAMGGMRQHAHILVETQPAGEAVDIQLEFPQALDYGLQDVKHALLLVRAIIAPLRVRLELSQGAQGVQQIRLHWPSASGGHI